MENGTQQESTVVGRTPPYVSFKSFVTLLEDFKASGVPPRIDRSVLRRFSGGLGSQLLVALRSLGLMDENGNPIDDLEILVNSYGSTDFPVALRRTLDTSYPFLKRVDLKTATPSMFAEAFQSGTNAKEDVLRKCRTFYLHAAKAADIVIGPRLEKGTYTRTASGNGRKKRKSSKPEEQAENTSSAHEAHTRVEHGKALEYQLIDLMTEPDIDDNVKQSIWSLVQYLTARKMKKAAASKDAPAS
ncbi:DUF5343 domain-containing protein [Mesorhizobium sp. AR07]|uniref:DUF5343 domain-containing protein n=1 Tax=Mesorhizobium sp. AR07 TaxID=2865838 RepID=UPI00215FE344|nr:DUF5343 domain-containing protein [Mesorhizobium sp. AR07]UVK41854.1 DUF5343 domain-containing protein [Mesorhizobium sp. AR07]